MRKELKGSVKPNLSSYFRGIMRAKEIKHIATSQLMQGGVLWIRAAVDSARNEGKIPLDSITCLARRMDQRSRRVC